MRICILSNKGSSLDEGQRNTASALAKELAVNNEVLHLNAKVAFKRLGEWRAIRSFNPDFIHFFLRPNIATFLAAKIFHYYFGVPVFFSALQPVTSGNVGLLLRLIQPTCVVALSEKTRRYFKGLGIKTGHIYCGVDTDKFKAVTDEGKTWLKKKYNFDTSVPVALHVGHLTKGRNLESLLSMQSLFKSHSVLIIASPLFQADKDIRNALKQEGAIIIPEYLADIQEIYQLSDVYIFPTVSNSHCIEAPLSVFEAMATNLPVITTRFGVLPEYFEQGDGLVFIDDPREIEEKIGYVRSLNGSDIRTREKVIKYTWRYAADRLTANYRESLDV